MSPEERARIARENGAKSRGPSTPSGKEKSARNSIRHGERTEKLTQFIPPHHAALCNEDRQSYYKLMDELLAAYQPVNALALGIVRDIAVARWQCFRYDNLISAHWNLAFLDHAQTPLTVPEELADQQTMTRAAEALHTGHAVIEKYQRIIDRLQIRIARLERRLKFVHTHFPVPSPERTQPQPPQPIENTEPDPQNTPENEQPIFITENTPEVIAYYKQQFPNREIVVLPADDVANGMDSEDNMPDIPRKVN